MSNEHAKTIMENGGEWRAGMRSDSGIRISHSLDICPSGIRDGDDRVRPDSGPVVVGELPDLTDGPTCRALWDQMRDRLSEIELAFASSGRVSCRMLTD